MQTLRLKKCLTDAQVDSLSGKHLTDEDYDMVITEDTDALDLSGNLIFKYRKKVIPLEILKLGYDSFKDSIELTDGRGMAAGGNSLRIRKDGTTSKISVAKKVLSGNVGYMDRNAMIHYCRKTAFARKYFDKFKQGIPFVRFVDSMYKSLCPEHYVRQIGVAEATDINYRIPGTSFTTVTVNQNFQTAVHKDSGDFPKGFGNLCVYREGEFSGSYFCLPQYRVAIDMQNQDILFADVHQWHGNTPFNECSEDYLRIAFVMYYREYMLECLKPKEELKRAKNINNYMTL